MEGAPPREISDFSGYLTYFSLLLKPTGTMKDILTRSFATLLALLSLLVFITLMISMCIVPLLLFFWTVEYIEMRSAMQIATGTGTVLYPILMGNAIVWYGESDAVLKLWDLSYM